MIPFLDHIKTTVPPALGIGGVEVVGWPWPVVVFLVLLFYGARPVRDWIDTWRYARRAPQIGEGAEARSLDPPTPGAE